MAVVGADYRFLSVDIEAYGSEADPQVFRRSSFGKRLALNSLNTPKEGIVYGKKLPSFFIGDDAFPLLQNLIKPYEPPQGGRLTDEQRIFGYRYCI